MPQFRDISTFTEKTSLDGSEEVQVSGTQKAKLVKLLEQLGENLQMSVPDKDRQTFPALGTTGKVQAWLSALAYAAGIRSVNEGTLSAPFRIITQTTSGSGLTIVSYMPADEESLKWEFGYGFIRMFYASGNLLANNPTDNVLLMNAAWESYPIRISELLGVTPFDQLTSVSSLTVKAGDNIRASASTLSVLVGGANVFSQNNEYMRDAVIVANYDATVSFTAKDSSVVVRKSADVGTVTATSGKKVYTLHWAPAALQGGKVSNWEVFVNVAVYA